MRLKNKWLDKNLTDFYPIIKSFSGVVDSKIIRGIQHTLIQER